MNAERLMARINKVILKVAMENFAAGKKAEREAILKLFEEKDCEDIEAAIRARGNHE